MNSPHLPNRTKQSIVPIALALAVVLYLFLAQRVFVYTPDDAYITFRYSRNLAEGYGPVFNQNAPVSDRTEGYSCALFMFLVAFLMKLPLGIDILFRAKFVGVACALGTLWLLPKLAQRLGLPAWAQGAAPLLLAAHTSFVITSVNAMETMPTAFLVTLAAYLFLKACDTEEETRPGLALASGMTFAACALMRPEGILFGLVATGALLYGRRGRFGKPELRWLLAFFGPVLVFLLWRKGYYGLWLPNTFYAKNVAIEEAAKDGFTYLLRTFFQGIADKPIYVALGAFWWLLAIAGGFSNRILQRPLRLALPLSVLMQVIFVLKAGGDGMGGWRFMASVVPILMLLTVTGIVEAQEGIAKALKAGGGATGYLAAGTFGTVILAACLLGQGDYWRDENGGYIAWAKKGFTFDSRKLMAGWLLELTLPISDWLNANLPPGSVVTYTEMGVTPYLSPQIRFLDADGLTDHGVATLPGAAHIGHGVIDNYTSMNDKVGPYLVSIRKPDYIMRGSAIEAGRSVPKDPILDGAYVFHAAIPLPKRDPDRDAYALLWKRANP